MSLTYGLTFTLLGKARRFSEPSIHFEKPFIGRSDRKQSGCRFDKVVLNFVVNNNGVGRVGSPFHNREAVDPRHSASDVRKMGNLDSG